MRRDHDVVCRRLAPKEWVVRCFTCDFFADELYRDGALRVRREHIEETCTPDGIEPELSGNYKSRERFCTWCGHEDHVVSKCPFKPEVP